MQNKSVLLRITNLKQYFPLKKKGLYVKANDGINLDIYEGETFGLVGESGCGKSTFGQTLLQLYRQTDGRSMYYGRSLDDLAPRYVKDTISKLEGKKAHMRSLEAKRDRLREEYDRLDDDAKLAKKDEVTRAEKEAHDALLDIVNLVGGFVTLDDLSPVREVFLRRYEQCKKLSDLDRQLAVSRLKASDLEFDVKEGKAAGRDMSAKKKKLDTARQRVQDTEKRIASEREVIASIDKEIEALRAEHRDDERFSEFEQYRDDGIDLARLTYNEMRRLRCDLQIIFQDPYSSLNPRMTVGQIIGEGPRTHKMFDRNDSRLQDYVLKVMDECGLQGYFLHRFPHQFSGGQRQRIGIARALAVRPKFVVCDEAVSALDVSIQSQIINLLQDLKEKQNLTYLFITHDLSVVKYISDRIGVMYLGNMVELADSQEIFSNPVHPYTEALLNAIPTTDVKRDFEILEGDIPSPVNPPKGCKFHTRCKYCTEVCRQVTPEWEEIAPNHFVACHHKLTHGETAKEG